METLERVQISGKAQRYIHQLSGGEKQRIAIARALLNDPEMIVADEPTGNLDPETSMEVMNLFETLHKRGNTVILATHDYRLIQRFNHPVIRCENQGIHRIDPGNS
jgi:cell division transport system ATP-binding protein